MLHAGNRIAKGLIEKAGMRWPKTTGDLAFCVFTRIPAPRGRKKLTGMPPGLRPVLLQTASGAVASWALPADVPSGRKALLVHGWNSHSRHMLSLARSLNKAGIDCVLIDLPGHGASSGRHLHLGKGIEAVDAAWRHHGPFDAFVGHSFGGAVVLNAALGSSMCIPARRPASLVMMASPNSLPAIFRGFGRMIGLPEPAQAAFERKVLTLLGQSIDLFVASDQLKDYHRPVLVVHDMDDRDVLYTDALRLKRAGPHVDLLTTSGLGHRRILKSAEVHAAIAERINAPVAPAELPAPYPRILVGDCV